MIAFLLCESSSGPNGKCGFPGLWVIDGICLLCPHFKWHWAHMYCGSTWNLVFMGYLNAVCIWAARKVDTHVASIFSAHALTPLSLQTSFTKHKFKDKFIKRRLQTLHLQSRPPEHQALQECISHIPRSQPSSQTIVTSRACQQWNHKYLCVCVYMFMSMLKYLFRRRNYC